MTVIGTETDFWKIKAINVWGGEAINEGTIKANNAYATQISSEGGKLINKGTIVVEGRGTGIDAANNNDNTVIENYGSIIALGEFTTDKTHAVANHMNNAQLNLSVWIDRLDGLREAFQTVNASNQNIFNTSVLKFG